MGLGFTDDSQASQGNLQGVANTSNLDVSGGYLGFKRIRIHPFTLVILHALYSILKAGGKEDDNTAIYANIDMAIKVPGEVEGHLWREETEVPWKEEHRPAVMRVPRSTELQRAGSCF